ncbi:NnrU protein [Paracoccus isoporae]|uniref:NnrU protein n=1 Tax=Paracoccus isoporae TaxID=591205 RepID=A0A1G7A602_9RHOB|nr:NnrU family protein [Paracoccus isoporae]SDE10201.1 NnrU protein [Paracoccus isoporae]
MFILILGVALWWAAHLFKRVAPAARRDMGQRGRGLVTAALIFAVLLMIWGYRVAETGAVWWGPSPMMKGINNLLVLAGLYLFAADGMKTRIGVRLRHPQLIGFSLWAVAHLLVNGDMPSFVLFGGLLAWALAEIVLINRAEPDWQPRGGDVSWSKDGMALIGALVVFGVIGLIHAWLGYNPFGA